MTNPNHKNKNRKRNGNGSGRVREAAGLIPVQGWLVIGGVLLILIVAGSFLAVDLLETLVTTLGRRWFLIAVVVAPIGGVAAFFTYYRHLSARSAAAFIALTVIPITLITVIGYVADPAAHYDIESMLSTKYAVIKTQVVGIPVFASMPTPHIQQVSYEIRQDAPLGAIQQSIFDSINNVLTGILSGSFDFYPVEGIATLAYWVQTPNGWVLAQTGTAAVRTDATTTTTAVFKIPDKPLNVVGITLYKARKNIWGEIPKEEGLDGGIYRFGEQVEYREILVE